MHGVLNLFIICGTQEKLTSGAHQSPADVESTKKAYGIVFLDTSAQSEVYEIG